MSSTGYRDRLNRVGAGNSSGFSPLKAHSRTRDVSLRLTPLVPQPPHSMVNGCRFPWSEGFERMFRNEGVTGSNPVSPQFDCVDSRWRAMLSR